MRERALSPGAKLAYARLCQFADKRIGIAWPGREKLAEELGVGARQVDRYLKEIEHAGLIEIRRQGFKKTNVYRFLWPAWLKADRKSSIVSTHDSTHLSSQDSLKASTQESPNMASKEFQTRDSQKTVNGKETGARAPGLVDNSRTLEAIAAQLYSSDPSRFHKLDTWIGLKRKESHIDADIAETLRALRRREEKHGAVDDWWAYLEGANGTGQSMIERIRSHHLQGEAAEFNKPGSVGLRDLADRAELAAARRK